MVKMTQLDKLKERLNQRLIYRFGNQDPYKSKFTSGWEEIYIVSYTEAIKWVLQQIEELENEQTT